jgi:hypothetical protein
MNAQQISNEDKSRITLVADALRRKAPQTEITATLIQSGLSASEASDFYATVTHGLRAGVTAGVTGGASAAQYSGGEPAIWQAAFDEGRRQFSGAVRGAWFQRLWWLVIPLAALIIWLLLR